METITSFDCSTSEAPVVVLESVLNLKGDIIANRRWFHKHPELGFQEFETSKRVYELLTEYGIGEIWRDIGKTGIIAIIRGAYDGPCIALRADMDALPLTETSTVDYRSVNDGVMHACGHDGHMAGLLAAAKILNTAEYKANMHGCVKLIFQPAEEGLNGASAMIKDGCLEDKYGPKVDYIFGIHLWSFTALGVIQCSNGPVMAASDRFEVEVQGLGGHGAVPHQSVDAIVAACQLVNSFQTIVSRNLDPLECGVITCGTINGGYSHNIIADKVTIKGTNRSFKVSVQDMMKSRMEQMCGGMSCCSGANIQMNYRYGYPATVNAYPACTALVRECAAEIVGKERSETLQRTMGAEDFSFYLQQCPGAFIFVGCRQPGECKPHHKSVFDMDENGMLISATLFIKLIHKALILQKFVG